MNVGIKLDVESLCSSYKHQDLRRANAQKGPNLSSILYIESYCITIMKHLTPTGNTKKLKIV